MTNKITIKKEKATYDREFKLKFLGEGEWVEELDTFIFEYKEFTAIVKRNILKEPYSKELAYFGGHLCGYVQIPESHPLFGKEEELNELDCYGGVTFNEVGPPHLIGFDCAHSFDYVPTMQKLNESGIKGLNSEIYKNYPQLKPTYKNMGFCISKCMEIIDQLIEIKQQREKN